MAEQTGSFLDAVKMMREGSAVTRAAWQGRYRMKIDTDRSGMLIQYGVTYKRQDQMGNIQKYTLLAEDMRAADWIRCDSFQGALL